MSESRVANWQVVADAVDVDVDGHNLGERLAWA